jgi:hypothetical protein
MAQRRTQFRTAKERGEWAEVRFLSRAVEQRFRVAKPWGDSAPYDLMVEQEGLVYRVQVKSTMRRPRGGAYPCSIPCGERLIHVLEEIDFVAAYLIPLDLWYIIPAGVVAMRKGSIWLAPWSDGKASTSDTWRRGICCGGGEEGRMPGLRTGPRVRLAGERGKSGYVPQGLKSVRENSCRPYGTGSALPLLPGTAVPGFHMPPLRGWNVMIPFHLFSQKVEQAFQTGADLRRVEHAFQACVQRPLRMKGFSVCVRTELTLGH